MMGATTGKVKDAIAGAAISQYTILKPGADDDTLVPAAAATDPLMAVALEDANQGDNLTVSQQGDNIANVVLGGAVSFGDPITSDANGNGIKAAPAAGDNERIIGFANGSGVQGDIIPVAISLGIIQG